MFKKPNNNRRTEQENIFLLPEEREMQENRNTWKSAILKKKKGSFSSTEITGITVIRKFAPEIVNVSQIIYISIPTSNKDDTNTRFKILFRC